MDSSIARHGIDSLKTFLKLGILCTGCKFWQIQVGGEVEWGALYDIESAPSDNIVVGTMWAYGKKLLFL